MEARIEFANDQLHIEGDIGFANVETCLSNIESLLTTQKSGIVRINFAHVKHLDGSIIALMTSLLRHVKSLGIKVKYLNVPDHILRISELYGVRALLPIVTASNNAD